MLESSLTERQLIAQFLDTLRELPEVQADLDHSEPAGLAGDRRYDANIDLQVQALEMSELRVLSTMAQGGAPGPEVSSLKVRGSEIQQRIISDHLLGKQKA